MANKKRFGIVAGMLALVAAVGATAGTTLAKYISSTTFGARTATVAKWGYTMTIDADNLFGTEYQIEEGNSTKLAKTDNEDGIVVNAITDDNNIVAPGTTGYTTLTLKGTAEVNTIFTIDVSTFTTIYLQHSGDEYYSPLAWKVNESVVEATSDTVSKNDVATELAKALIATNDAQTGVTLSATTVKAKDGVVSVFLPAGSSFNTDGLVLKISWTWTFDTNDAQNDMFDTILGYFAAGKPAGAVDASGNAIDYTKYAANLWTTLNYTAKFEQTQLTALPQD